MANFPGGGFSTGFARGAAVAQGRRAGRLEEQQLKEAKLRRAEERLKDAFEQSRTSAESDFQASLDLITEAGAKATDEQISALTERAMLGPETHALFLAQRRAEARVAGATDEQLELMPSPGEFIENKRAVLQSTTEVAQLAREQTETLTPEQLQELGGFPEGAVVQRDPEGGLTLVFDPTENPSAIQERVQVLRESGVSDEAAKGIAGGRFAVSVNPISGERQVIDIATGEQIGGGIRPEPSGEVIPMVPEDLDTASATGLPGLLRNSANAIVGAFNAALPFEESQEASAALTSLQEFTGITLQAEVPGRPSNFLQQRLRELTVTPNSITQGRERARIRLTQTRQLLAGEIARIENEVLPQELQPAIRVDTNLNLSRLKRLDEAYSSVIRGLDPQGQVNAQRGQLARQAREALEAGNLEEAQRLIDEATGIGNGGQ